MEDMVVRETDFWRGKSVFVTGHTGFKGAWLSLWLADRGARVFGFSLPPPSTPSFFEACRVEHLLAEHSIGDIRDRGALAAAIKRSDPHVIFHLAAQPLVRESYTDPVFTVETNVIGTLNVLEASRSLKNLRALVNVTTDKCYSNGETSTPFSEGDPLGGYDCYSASKACSEILTSAYRSSFLSEDGPCVASARAGNVIGGGDWSRDRLIPDFFRAAQHGTPLRIRYPQSIRPWQHVLEVLHGYMMLAERLSTHGREFAEAWNFGPDPRESQPVAWVIDALCSTVSGATWIVDEAPRPHEAALLTLDSSKSRRRLGWHPTWALSTALAQTSEWYGAYYRGEDMLTLSRSQIARFVGRA
jgi:CDP-glucose 4,6-dehydratase